MPTRRQLIISATLAAAHAPLLARAETALPELDPSDPIALALGYQPDVTLVDTTKFPKRATPEGQSQYCHNCALYKETQPGLGTCSAIRGKLVAGEGWCNAWIPQP